MQQHHSGFGYLFSAAAASFGGRRCSNQQKAFKSTKHARWVAAQKEGLDQC